MIAIVAVDEKWGIGYRGRLLAHIPEDLRDNFKFRTKGNTVVYGRKTLSSFPGERLLPDRNNIILSRDPGFTKEGAVILHSEREFQSYREKHEDETFYLSGGGAVYRLLLPDCHEAVVTKIRHTFLADSWFPDLDRSEDWELTDESPVIHSVSGYDFSVCIYKKKP